MSIMPAGIFDWLSAVSVALATGLVSHVLRLNTRFHVMEALNKKTDEVVATLQTKQSEQGTELALHKEQIHALKAAVDTISVQLNGISEKTSLLPAINTALDNLKDEFRWLRDQRSEGKHS